MRLLPPIVAVCATGVIALAGCASTQLKEQWRDPAYQAAGAQRLLVIAVMSRTERRRVFEDAFVARLADAGVAATVSYPSLSVSGPENLAAVRQLVNKTGATSVLSVRLADVADRTVVSGSYYAPLGFSGYYPYAWSGAHYDPLTVSTYRTYVTETRLFDMKSDKMVWAASMVTEDPSDFDAAAKQYASLVVKQLQNNQMIAPRKR